MIGSISIGRFPTAYCAKRPNKSPSFPHVLSGNPGETLTRPLIPTFELLEFPCKHHTFVAFTPPDFLNRRECRLQSQPQALQYHSVMPSHSSRSARIARPALICFACLRVGMPWTVGTISVEP